MVLTKDVTIRNFESGGLLVFQLSTQIAQTFAKTKENTKDNIVYSLQDATSWYYNFNR